MRVCELKVKTPLKNNCKELLKSGVTTCEVKSGYGLSVEHEIKMLQAINECNDLVDVDLIPTCLAAHTLPKEFSIAKEYLEYLVQDLLPTVKERKLSNHRVQS